MELRNIDTFLKVAATQNFSKAAEQLGYSQSAVTVQIQKLEKELGVQLFERIGKRVFLTEDGERFISYANDIMKVTYAAKTFSKKDDKVKGVLRIGGVESICTALLPELLLEFYKLCPEVEVVIRSGATNDLLNLLNSNELDLVFTLDQKIFRPELSCDFQKEEEILFVTLADQGKDVDRILSAKELCSLPFLLTEAGAAYRYELESILAPKELSIRPILEIGNTETIINLLEKGMGVSFLPKFTVKKELKNHTLIQLHTDLPKVTMLHQLIHHKNKWLTSQMEIFMKLVQDYFR